MYPQCSASLMLLGIAACVILMVASASAGPSYPEYRQSAFTFRNGLPKDENIRLIEDLISNGGLGARVMRPPGFEDAAPNKRQLRYHQCYFNPVSCFKRK